MGWTGRKVRTRVWVVVAALASAGAPAVALGQDEGARRVEALDEDEPAVEHAIEGGPITAEVVSFADFRPQSPASEDCIFAPDTGQLYADLGTCCAIAPVHLPDGVTIQLVTFWLVDADATDFTMALRRKRVSTTTASTVMAQVATSGDSFSVRPFADNTIADATIDNALYSYFLSTENCLGEDGVHAFVSALIDY